MHPSFAFNHSFFWRQEAAGGKLLASGCWSVARTNPSGMADLPSVSVGRSRSIEQTGKIRESLQALKMAQESEMTQINAHFEMSAARQLAVHDKIAAAGRHGIELTTQLVEQHEKVAEEMHTLAGKKRSKD